MNTVNPITPDEVGAKKATQIPSFVIEAFNIEIAKHYDNVSRTATVSQSAILEQIALQVELQFETPEDTPVVITSNLKKQVYGNKWLNVEAMYEDAGWKVSYEKPGFNEIGDAYFTFKKK